MRLTKVFTLAASAAIALSALTLPAAAENVTLKAASCFPKGHYFSKRFEAMLDELGKQGGAHGIQVNYLGGAPAIGSPFEVVQKAARGIYDITSCTGAYYQNVLPEADALKMWEKSPAEIRANGGIEYLNELHHAKNLHFLSRVVAYTPFHLYLNKKIDKPDLSGLKLRVSPIYAPFFQDMGATIVQSSLAEIFTYMENGTVDGYGWPLTGMLPDWLKVTKYRVDPGFYDTDIQVLVNYDTYKKLSPAQRTYLDEVGVKYEKLADEEKQAAVEGRAIQDKAGIETIEFTGADREKWLSAARESGWKSINEKSPQHGPKLREFFAAGGKS